MELIINGIDCLVITATADLMKTTIPRLLMLVKQGVLEGWLVDGTWYISKQSIIDCPGADSIPRETGGGCSGCGGGCGPSGSCG